MVPKRKSTRERILETSIQLFNEEGVETVTTRHIGAALSISQGNVHYHFSTKNAILLALFDEFLSKLVEAERFEGDAMSGESIKASMESSLDIMYAYRFLFRDSHVVWRRLPDLRSQIMAFLAKKQKDIRLLIEAFRTGGQFREDISDVQADFLAEHFIFSISAWLNASAYQKIDGSLPGHYVGFLYRMWLPYLKPEVMRDWETIA